jgi:hypothetical protein
VHIHALVVCAQKSPPSACPIPSPKFRIQTQHEIQVQRHLAAAGVIVEPFLRNYVTQGGWQIDFNTLTGRVAFGLIIGIMILPAVYRQAFDPQKPILVQLAAIFPMGIGWQSLVGSSAKFLVP